MYVSHLWCSTWLRCLTASEPRKSVKSYVMYRTYGAQHVYKFLRNLETRIGKGNTLHLPFAKKVMCFIIKLYKQKERR